jgi:Reverse transcriptase (RNA-dependent DNA polymerase)
MDIDKAARLSVENILKEGLNDIFPPPQELELLKSEQFRKFLSKEVSRCIRGNSLESLAINPIEHVLLPKGGPFDFRRCALIQPQDTANFLALTLTLADVIEKERPSARKHVVFSYRLKPSKGYLFHPKYNFTTFRKYVSSSSHNKSTKFLVKCDIANFYDRLNLHRLESILFSLPLEKTRVRQLNQLLLFWANRDSYGLPVGSNGSRILAEAALIEVDKYMLSIGANFCRFVDDYRFFAPNAHKAHYWLTQLIERLWLEGLTINMAKTIIEDVSEKIRPSDTQETKSEIAPLESDQQESTQEKITEKDKLQHRVKIVAGYGGIIPTRFRSPHKAEIERLKDANCEEKLAQLRKKKLPEAEDITDFVKSVISTERFRYLANLPEVADLFPQFTPYVVDVLAKYGDRMSESSQRVASQEFSKRLKESDYLPEYIGIAIVRLLGTKGFEDKATLLHFFRNLKRNAGAYIGRALLDALENYLNRGEVMEIKKYFSRADQWEKREIVRIIDKHLHEEEKRPWLKNVITQEARDLFLVEQIKPTKKK